VPRSIVRRPTRARLAALLALCAALTACEKESAPTGPQGPDGTLELNEVATVDGLNASSTDTLVRFSFQTGTLVSASADWDVAFRRYEIRLNGGISGSKGVTAFSVGNNKAATNDQIMAFTAENTLGAFDAIRAAQIPASGEFGGDGLVENATGYLNLAGVPSANGTAFWKVKLATGGFALLRVTAISFTPQFALQSATIESRLQSGTTLGAPRTLVVTPAGGPASVNLTTNAQVAANGCNWDVQFNPQSLALSVNSACAAGTFPGGASPAFADVTSANDAPQYGAFLAGLTGPVPNSVTDVSAPFRYNLQGNNRLHPTFNTYLIKSGTSVFKLQVINYYGADGSAARLSIRYAQIQ
jgi:hypothetical protein